MTRTITLLSLLAVLSLGACAKPDLLVRTGADSRGVRFASAALAGGLPQAALNATRSVLERDPHNVQALLQQGEALAALGRGDAASEAYRRVLASEAAANGEQSRTARLGVGRAELAAGRAAQAEAVYRQLLAAAPNDASGRSGLGIALDLQGRHRDAQAEYQLALAQSDNDGTRVNLGLSLAMAGDPVAAMSVLRPLAQDPAATTRVRHNLAFALELAGDRTGAERILAADLPQAQVVVALSGYDAFRKGGP